MRFQSLTHGVQRLGRYENSLRLALGFASLTSATWLVTADDENMKDETKYEKLSYAETVMKSPRLLATSGSTIDRKAQASSSSNVDNSQQSVTVEPITVDYDFIVLGNGNAGLSAVRTLREKCSSAKIALVDPLRAITSTTKKLDYWPHTVTGFDPVTRTVQLNDPTHQLRYQHGILIATGSRGAPPPPSLLDEETMDRVIELRSTSSPDNTARPALSPKTVRQMTLLAASQGATVGVLGSGWEAVELAVAAASVGSKEPMLAFGSAAPLSHILPRYLSTAVTRRLRQQGVDIQPRSLVRYVSLDRQQGRKGLEVHTAKSYDMIDTKRTSVDLLVVAPYVDSSCGTAVLPTANTPQHLEPFLNAQPWFQSWSQLTSLPTNPSIVVCYEDDGRIMVNSELQAASRVYAAGSVARYPNSITGNAHVAGEGSEDGARAGRMAALHMVRDYIEQGRSLFSGEDSSEGPKSFAGESFPLSRSDMCTYLHGDTARTTYLSEIGVTALCVGQCDSERMSTHGFWWTNQSAQRLSVQATESDPTSRRRTTRRQRRSSTSISPVYGIGVVYYLDRKGRIRGIMTWGLPFTSGRKESHVLNEALVSRMKEVICTNGGISQWGPEENSFLHSFHLSEESKKLVGLSLAKGLSRRNTSGNMQRLMVPVEKMGKPLHRYTPAKPSSITGLQMVKRNDNAQGEARGESLYVKDDDEEFDSLRPPTLMYVFPMHNPRDSPGNASGDVPFHMNEHERLERALNENERRARPSKEEPLWLRRGDARRATSQAALLEDIIARNISKGKFADGSDALRQAPTPKSVQAAKDTISQWMNTGDQGGVSDTNEGAEER